MKQIRVDPKYRLTDYYLEPKISREELGLPPKPVEHMDVVASSTAENATPASTPAPAVSATPTPATKQTRKKSIL